MHSNDPKDHISLWLSERSEENTLYSGVKLFEYKLVPHIIYRYAYSLVVVQLILRQMLEGISNMNMKIILVHIPHSKIRNIGNILS